MLHTTLHDTRATPTKVKRRDTVDVIVGGVLGPIDHPEVVIAGRYRGGDLVMVGRTVPLTAAQSAELGVVLRPARRGHPWPTRSRRGAGAGRIRRNRSPRSSRRWWPRS